MYWEIGAYVSDKVKNGGWGKSVVTDFARFIQAERPDIKGFSASNIWRMRQFYETYCENEKLAPHESDYFQAHIRRVHAPVIPVGAFVNLFVISLFIPVRAVTEQFVNADLKHFRKLRQYGNIGHGLLRFPFADRLIGYVELIGKLLLRHPVFLTVTRDVP
jgi:hypothetical protein